MEDLCINLSISVHTYHELVTNLHHGYSPVYQTLNCSRAVPYRIGLLLQLNSSIVTKLIVDIVASSSQKKILGKLYITNSALDGQSSIHRWYDHSKYTYTHSQQSISYWAKEVISVEPLSPVQDILYSIEYIPRPQDILYMYRVYAEVSERPCNIRLLGIMHQRLPTSRNSFLLFIR